VEQEDVFLGTATVRETLVYAAMLLLPRSRSVEEKMEIVEDVIEEMDLKGCADTRIGTANKRGISGGEAKRTAIAMELITNPSKLFILRARENYFFSNHQFTFSFCFRRF
jgi:ABC-type multidrug transport system ATPase subunit